jgi:aspartate aminotransferase
MVSGISKKIEKFMSSGSWIRKMFEEGAILKQKYGADQVFDFSLGNPMGEPPRMFLDALRHAIDETTKGTHSYMPNAGFMNVRNHLAEKLSLDHGVALKGKNLIMTVGAAGALNVTLKALIDPGDTVIIFAPYFVEYLFYVDNVNGNARIVETDDTFNLDLDAIEKALDSSVKALIINTPNNPTGRVYSRETLNALCALLDRKSREFDHPIYLISDEPYKRIVYDDVEVPSLLKLYHSSLVCTSYSKELSIPGERIGYVAVNPNCPDADILADALTFCNRILGFVNAPALMQRALSMAGNAMVDMTSYIENRKIFLEGLRALGYEIVTPEGAFYLFPKSPIPDEVRFI